VVHEVWDLLYTILIYLVLSELSSVNKVMGYFTTTIQRLSSYQRRGFKYEVGGLEDAFKDIPSLL
jgi:hypothetical protein